MRRILTCSITILLGLIGAPLQAQTPDVEAEIRAVATGFGAALAHGDSTAALGLLHDDVRIMEGGRTETKTQYRSGHLRSDIAFASAVRTETVRDAVTVIGDIALYTSQSRRTGTYRNRPIDSTGNEAMVLIRTPAGWRIQMIHWP
ncbi:MAG TPA: nuclear transport factor 2 family protein [Longimicrobiales bacterium]|nr:nuclear transport factor 2 family protein [Longimicrobiales bacterium]